MPLISHFKKFSMIPWCFKKPHQGFSSPKNLVRFCRKPSYFTTILNEGINSRDLQWSEETIELVIEHILGNGGAGISVYNADIPDPLDPGHSLALIAESINQKDFLKTATKRKNGCTRGSLIIPINCLPKSTAYEFTPKNNLNFYPANARHFDLTINNETELAIAILKGINQGAIKWTRLSQEKKTYWVQAAIAYSYCVNIFGYLDPSDPPSEWIDGKDLTASEQIEILKHLAQTEQFNQR